MLSVAPELPVLPGVLELLVLGAVVAVDFVVEGAVVVAFVELLLVPVVLSLLRQPANRVAVSTSNIAIAVIFFMLGISFHSGSKAIISECCGFRPGKASHFVVLPASLQIFHKNFTYPLLF